MTTTIPEIKSSQVMHMEIRDTTWQTRHQAALVLSRAFVDDPVSTAVYKNYSPERLVKALLVDFSAEVVECVRRGHPIQVNEGEKTLGAAVIYQPGGYPLPVLNQWLLLIKSIWGNGFYDIGTWTKWLSEVDKLHPARPHYYLEYLGVEPEYQGKGVGTAILHHLCSLADVEGVGCYLENANPRNTKYYQRFGFQVIHEKDISGIRTWFMWRAAQN